MNGFLRFATCQAHTACAHTHPIVALPGHEYLVLATVLRRRIDEQRCTAAAVRACGMHVLRQQCSSNVLRCTSMSTYLFEFGYKQYGAMLAYEQEISPVHNEPRKRSPRRQGPIESLLSQPAWYRTP